MRNALYQDIPPARGRYAKLGETRAIEALPPGMALIIPHEYHVKPQICTFRNSVHNLVEKGYCLSYRHNWVNNEIVIFKGV